MNPKPKTKDKKLAPPIQTRKKGKLVVRRMKHQIPFVEIMDGIWISADFAHSFYFLED